MYYILFSEDFHNKLPFNFSKSNIITTGTKNECLFMFKTELGYLLGISITDIKTDTIKLNIKEVDENIIVENGDMEFEIFIFDKDSNFFPALIAIIIPMDKVNISYKNCIFCC